MSAYVQVRDGGLDIHVICNTCGLDQRCEFYRGANAIARDHNNTHHVNAINWAS